MIRVLLLAAALPLMTAAFIPSSPELGKAEGQCRPGEPGPAFMVEVIGIKDHTGHLKVEVYPANDTDFLADDNILLMAGKTFRRVEVPTPGDAVPHVCIRVPGPGRYAVTVLHDRDNNHRFNWTRDGIGFSANPHIFVSKPKAGEVAVSAGGGITPLRVVMNYRNGLFSIGPLAESR